MEGAQEAPPGQSSSPDTAAEEDGTLVPSPPSVGWYLQNTRFLITAQCRRAL